MNCPKCRAENDASSHFCEECGTRLEQACSNCGQLLTPGKKFCRACGTPVAPGESAAPVSPAAYTPAHLAEKILTSRSALEGERKQVTVLFADLKGSMELLADRDPEEARKLLDPVLERMMEAVHRYEGTVNQVMGDGIMALFGAPLAHEDHAVRGCYAALRMQETVRRYAEEVYRSEGIAVQIRVGLNSGEVVVRSIGSDLRMDYSAVGQTTHLAARMEQLATPGTILLTPAALQLAEGFVEVKPKGPVPVKGVAQLVEVFELAGVGAVRSRLEAAAARGLTGFVGRDSEIAQLGDTLARVAGGQGQLVAVVGEAGVGKSRLYWEFTHSYRTQGWMMVDSGSVSYGKATAYLPVIELLKTYFQIETRDDPRRMREKVTGKLLSLDRALEPCLPALLSLLDLPAQDAAWDALDSATRRQRTLDAVKRLLLRESQVQPLLVMFEDLHWIDTETQALLDSMVESLPTARILLLVNYRPEYHHGWGGKTYYRQIRIDPLAAASAGELLAGLMGNDASLEALKAKLIERTEGNPFYLEESVRMLVETGALTGERGGYRLAAAKESTDIPLTVQAILSARIDRLSPEDKRLLQSAAVIGKHVPFALLQAIAELTKEQLYQGIGRLQAAEFLYEARLFPDLEYTFKHALTHEVAYRGVVQERRRALHAAIAEAIERLYADRLPEHIERLAHHALRGEMWAKAEEWLRQAGAKAVARASNEEAVNYVRDALSALAHLPESRTASERFIDLSITLRSSFTQLGEIRLALEKTHAAQAAAERIDDRRRLGRVLALMTNSYLLMGEPRRAVETGLRAIEIAEANAHIPSKMLAIAMLGQSYYSLGDYQRAVELLTPNAEIYSGERQYETFGITYPMSVYFRVFLSLTLARLGQFAESAKYADEALRIAEAMTHPPTLSFACWPCADTRLQRGESEGALPAAERGYEIALRLNLPLTLFGPSSMTALSYARGGRTAEALTRLAQTESFATQNEAKGYLIPVAWAYPLEAEAYLLLDRPDDAVRIAARAAEFSKECGARGHEAEARQVLAKVAMQRADFAEAGTQFAETLRIAEELGMRPLIAHCLAGLGRLCLAKGERDQARTHLTKAAAMYREMEMTYWLRPVDVELMQIT